MESIIEDVEDERKTKGSPANSQSYKNLVGSDVFRYSKGVDQSFGLFTIFGQVEDDIDCKAIICRIIGATLHTYISI